MFDFSITATVPFGTFFVKELDRLSRKMGGVPATNLRTKTIDSGARWTEVDGGVPWCPMVNETTPPTDLTNPGYCPKRPYTHMHAGHSVLPSVS